MFSSPHDPSTPGSRAPPRHTYGRRSVNRTAGRNKRPSPPGSDTDTDGSDDDTDDHKMMGNAKGKGKAVDTGSNGTPGNRDAKRARVTTADVPTAALSARTTTATTLLGSPTASSGSSRTGLMSGASLVSTSSSQATAASRPVRRTASNDAHTMLAPVLASSPSLSSVESPPTKTTSAATPRNRANPQLALHPPSSSPVAPSPVASAIPRAGSPLRRSPRHSPAPASPKDLSALFAVVSPGPSKLGPTASGSSLGGGGGEESQGSTSSNTSARSRRAGPRRMLSKAQSMQVAASAAPPTQPSPPSTPRALRLSQSMPITPGSAQSDKTGDVAVAAGSPVTGATLVAPIPGSPGSGGRARRTYGAARSFLSTAELSMDDEPRESYAERRKRYETDNDGDDGATRNLYAELQLANAPERISDMRSKGENRRVMDEIAYLLDSLSQPSQTTKRSTALDILDNMQRVEWIDKMQIVDKTGEIFAALCGGDDILDATALIFLALLVAKDKLAIVLSAEDQVVAFATRSLAQRAGPLDTGYKSKLTPSIRKLRDIASKLYPPAESGAVSTRRFASLILARACHESTWPLVERTVMTEHVSHAALESLTTEIHPLRERLELYAKGLDLAPKEAAVDMVHLQQCLEVLGSIVMYSPEERERMMDTDQEHVQDVVDVLVAMSAATLDDDDDLKLQAAQNVVLALQLLTPLAPSPKLKTLLPTLAEQPGAMTALARSLVTRQELSASLRRPTDYDDAGSVADDGTDGDGATVAGGDIAVHAGTTGPAALTSTDEVLALVLAMLGTMTLASSEAAVTIATTPVPLCGKRSCALACKCTTPDPQALATVLAQVYTHDLATRLDDSFAAYLHGYVAFLITKLLVVDANVSTSTSTGTSVRALVEAHLPGTTWTSKQQGLLGAIKELSSVTAIAHGKMRALVDDSDAAHGRAHGAHAAHAAPADEGTPVLLRAAMEELRGMIAQ